MEISNENMKRLMRIGVPVRDMGKELFKLDEEIVQYNSSIGTLELKLKAHKEVLEYLKSKRDIIAEILNKPV
jgi:CII-binding regulator of phage lambda lysogenization HflD